VAGLAITAFIVHVFRDVTSEIVRHLTDRVEAEYLEAAQLAAAGVPGLRDVLVRGRWMGPLACARGGGAAACGNVAGACRRDRPSRRRGGRLAVAEVREVQWILRGAAPTTAPAT
jgi:hypothetical protein